VLSGAILNLGETISMLAGFAWLAPLKVTVIEKLQARWIPRIPRIHSMEVTAYGGNSYQVTARLLLSVLEAQDRNV